MLILRRILRGGTRRTLLLSLGMAAVMLGTLVTVPPAEACWRSALIECFDRFPTEWIAGGCGWRTPVGGTVGWTSGGNLNVTWGITDRIFNSAAPGCSANSQSLWCIGCPDRGQDPDFDVYPANTDVYTVWGPVNLSIAVASQASFWLYSRCGQGDSVFWGASFSPNLSASTMLNSGRRLGRTTDWEMQIMDLTRLRNSNGDSISALGHQAVYLFWRLKADGSEQQVAQHDMGAFIDNITVTWDDGQRDMRATTPVFYEVVDTTYQVLTQARVGDEVYAAFSVTTCSGGLSRYPAFNVMAWLNDTLKVYDSTYTGVSSATSLMITTQTWQVLSPDSHWLKVYVDSANVVSENNETNNRPSNGFSVLPPNPPPTFEWTIATDDTLEIFENSLLLRWIAHDTLEQAHIALYYDADDAGCTASAIVGGNNRLERDGPDSLFWNITLLAMNTPYYLLARVYDSDTSICLHTAFPFVKRSTIGAVDGDRPLGGVPEHFFLAQNYPNPFNPQTELRFGLAKAGHVTLRVFDTLGREVAKLVDGERSPGSYGVTFDGSQFATGLYFYTISTPEGTDTRKMMLMK